MQVQIQRVLRLCVCLSLVTISSRVTAESAAQALDPPAMARSVAVAEELQLQPPLGPVWKCGIFAVLKQYYGI
jgi:hypothetical protein